MPSKPRRSLRVGAVACLALVVLGGTVWSYQSWRASIEQTTAATTGIQITAPPEPSRPEPKRDLTDVMPRLQGQDRPFNLVVLTDSTGADLQGWPQIVAEWLGRTYDRDVHFRQWIPPEDLDEQNGGAYAPEYAIPDGSGADLNWFNGAAPGRNLEYVEANLQELIPLRQSEVDLIIVSAGHNEREGLLDDTAGDLMNMLVDRYDGAAVIGILQNPESEKSPDFSIQERNVQRFSEWCGYNRYQCVDVHSAFVDKGIETLIDETMVHPSTNGYALWADVVIESMRAAAGT